MLDSNATVVVLCMYSIFFVYLVVIFSHQIVALHTQIKGNWEKKRIRKNKMFRNSKKSIDEKKDMGEKKF